MSTSSTTGFCRVTVVAPDSRIDVALPEDIPLADIYPEVLRLSGQTLPKGAPVGFHLVRRDGTVLDSSLPLIAQQVRDGDLLSLRPFADSLPRAVYDDVADAVASAVATDRSQWNDQLLRTSGLIGSVVVLTLLGFALWSSDLAHDMHSLPGLLSGVTAVLLVALAGVRGRVYHDRGSALALGLAALPHALIGGSGIVAPAAGQGPGRIQFLTGCVVVLVASVLLTALMPGGDAPFVAAVLVSAAGTAATFAAILGDASARDVASVAAVVAVALIGFLPQLSARFARLPVAFHAPRQATGRGEEAQPDSDADAADYARIALRARRGHELLGGLVGGCAAVLVGGAAVLAFTDSRWPELLALALGVTAMMRARLFRHTSQVLCLLVAGLLALGLLIVGVSLDLPRFLLRNLGNASATDLHTIALGGAVALVAALLTAVALVVPAKGVSPFWARILDLADGLALASLVPLVLAVLDVYARVRGLTG
ncbi:type VII secretion integral membrane protein EccD [Streptacidiphilus sp. PB12-B1b]|uniref:type VII secretion integral membrane protein EccD n=1 Tax=Streptacidiphilus sp. PB12-B1b TaxID=2705012 RepID=UPI0015FD2A17|nr:type VII secretion integral membrane protein EccD [Streptacidiphilus sp. PB12-B1b]QMU78788.1 type VII secretion integral membrane protein EccD [Streptacidiphilus sp. PB12-B1b]